MSDLIIIISGKLHSTSIMGYLKNKLTIVNVVTLIVPHPSQVITDLVKPFNLFQPDIKALGLTTQ